MQLIKRSFALLVIAGFIATTGACSAHSTTGSSASASSTLALQVATGDLYAGTPQRVQVGLEQSTGNGIELLTGGSIPLSLAPADGSGQAIQGVARYVPAPGTPSAKQPTFTPPSTARGVYQLEEVTFPAPGVWEAAISFKQDNQPVSLTTQFGVSDHPALPAIGQAAQYTKNLTMADSNVNPEAIDSRAQGGAKVPDPELHQETIADALKRHQPVLALFATPVYCMSQWCGPSTDALEQLSKVGPSNAAYIHVEIYKDYAKAEINQAALQWVQANGEVTDPWLFLIGRVGKILDRWAPLFNPREVLQEVKQAAA